MLTMATVIPGQDTDCSTLLFMLDTPLVRSMDGLQDISTECSGDDQPPLVARHAVHHMQAVSDLVVYILIDSSRSCWLSGNPLMICSINFTKTQSSSLPSGPFTV